MYSVYAGDVCIYNDVYMDDSLKLQSPKLDLVEAGAGTFSVKIPPSNVGYNIIERLITEIIVKREGQEIWSGRVLTIKEDFQKNKTLTCEGELSYLNDTIQPQQAYDDMSLYAWLNTLLTVHNEKISADKKFYIGYVDSALNVTIYDPYTNYENTLTAISTIVNNYGGYLNFRKENGKRYLDYISDSNRNTAAQTIRFGKNLLDFTKSYDSTDFCTAILPLGERLENSYGISMSGIDGVDAHVTVEDVNGGDPYVSSASAVSEFGWICKKVEFDTNDEEELLELAQEYLSETQFDTMVLEANAVDLSYLEVDSAKFNLSEKIRVVSKPHGMDTYLTLTKISIPLDNPANTSYTLGTEVKTSLSARSASANFNFNSYIDNTLGDKSLVNIAKTNANVLINSFSTGYFTVTQKDNGSNEVYFSDTKISDGYDPEDPMKEATSYWRWNLNGLAYYNKNGTNKGNADYKDPTDGLRLALTKDGQIVGDYISVGVLKDSLTDGQKFYLNFNTGVVKMNVTELNIAGYSAATQSYASTAASNAVNNLDSSTILNKIRNGWQGIGYNSSTGFYISASYIKAGVLDATNVEVSSGTSSGSKLVLTAGKIEGYLNNSSYGIIEIGSGSITRTYGPRSKQQVVNWSGGFFNFGSYDLYLKGTKLVLDFTKPIIVRNSSGYYRTATNGGFDVVTEVEFKNSGNYIYQVQSRSENTVIGFDEWGNPKYSDRISEVWGDGNNIGFKTKTKRSLSFANGLIWDISDDNYYA